MVFRHTISGQVLNVSSPHGKETIAAVKRFQHTGKNPYVGDADAITTGEQLYIANCMICHGPKGVGKMGPSLVDKALLYEKNASDKGLFETIYGGTVNLMTGWQGRLSPDEILRIIAYLRALQRR
ncbi:MAG: c-type cytochrome [Acidiferrobacterales bacterium]